MRWRDGISVAEFADARCGRSALFRLVKQRQQISLAPAPPVQDVIFTAWRDRAVASKVNDLK